jgi:methylglyoxal reductase
MLLHNGIGLGTFPFANVFTKISEGDHERIVHAFIDEGGKYIQTAPYYHGVYEILAPILRGFPRDAYYLATSCVKNRAGDCKWDYHSIIEQCDDSLKHLGIDFIDFLFTSDPNPSDPDPSNTSFEETMTAMRDLQKQGKVSDIGVANVTLDELKKYNGSQDVRYVQNRFSLINRTFDSEWRAYCTENSIGFIPFETIERGMLTTKGLTLFPLSDDDFRRKKPEFRDEARQLVRDWVEDYLHPIAASMGISIEALVIWWTLQQPNIAACAVGATNTDEVRRNFLALHMQGQPGTVDLVEQAYAALEAEVEDRYSTSVQKFLGIRYRP